LPIPIFGTAFVSAAFASGPKVNAMATTNADKFKIKRLCMDPKNTIYPRLTRNLYNVQASFTSFFAQR
jgi:hypothetical protein